MYISTVYTHYSILHFHLTDPCNGIQKKIAMLHHIECEWSSATEKSKRKRRNEPVLAARKYRREEKDKTWKKKNLINAT